MNRSMNPRHFDSNYVQTIEIVRWADEALEPKILRKLADEDWYIVGAYKATKPKKGTVYIAEKILCDPTLQNNEPESDN